MGLPALRQQPATRARKPHLRLVKAKPSTGRRGSSQAQVAVARQNFRLFVALLALIGLLGIGRVWLTVEATEASLEANELRASIKSERYEGDMLEVRQSALGSPSRIRAIAGKAMDMAPAGEVTYLDLTKKASKKPAATQPSVAKADASGFEAALGKIMTWTAGEAEVLLVGDVGLASTR